MRILFLTQWFEPEPFFKGLPLALALQERGHDIEVVTGFPNYPGGQVYDGYKVRAYDREMFSGVLVHRVPLYPSHDRSSIRRTLNYSSFALSAAAIGALVTSQRDVAYVYHPPATIGLPALTQRVVRRVPFVLDVQDLWPDSLSATGMLGARVILTLVGSWCRLVYRAASRIVVLSPGFKNALAARGVPPTKIEVIYNWCDEQAAGGSAQRPVASGSAGLPEGFNVVFAGNLGRAQGLGTVLDAAAILRGTGVQARFVFIGSGVEEALLRARVAEQNLENVVFFGRVSPQEAGRLLRCADALLVHLRDEPLFEITIPSKTQAYLAAGRPLLMGVRGDAADLVRKAGAGFCFVPGDAAGLASRVRQLMSMSSRGRDEVGSSGRQFYVSELAMDVGVPRLEAVLEAAAAGRGAVQPS